MVALLFALLLHACGGSSVSDEVLMGNKDLYGVSVDGSVKLVGQLGPGHPGRDSLALSMQTPSGDLKCSGVLSSSVTFDDDDCSGLTGHNYMSCNGSSPLLLRWEAIDCARGTGASELPDGKRISFAYGFANEEESLAAIAENQNHATHDAAESKSGTLRSGVFVSDDGIFITDVTGHEKSKTIKAVFPAEKKVVEAKILSVDHKSGLAVAKVNRRVKAVPISASVAQDGDRGVILGYFLPAGKEVQLRARSAVIQAPQDSKAAKGKKQDKNLLRLNVPIERAYAGGPLLSDRGAIMGLATLKASTEQESHVVRSDVIKALLAAVPEYKPTATEPMKAPDLKGMSRERKDGLLIVRIGN